MSLSLAAVTLLSACAGHAVTVDNPQLVAAPDKVSMMLADAADRSSRALESLAAVEQARTPDIAVGPIPDAPQELRRAITVNWIGPVEPIAKTLADRAGYTFQAIGDAPPVPIVVNLDVENRPVVDVLRDIGLQMGTRADIRVDAPNRVVEVHYAPVTGVGTQGG